MINYLFSFVSKSALKILDSKKSQILIISIIVIFNSCEPCSDCVNNLDKLISEFSEYQENDIIKFINDDSVVRIDTVSIIYNSTEGKYDCIGSKESSNSCSGNYIISFGDFNLELFQDVNLYQNSISKYAKFGRDVFDIMDTLKNYNYNGNIIDVIHYQIRDEKVARTNYYDFILTFQNKLLEYQTKINQVQQKWILIEN